MTTLWAHQIAGVDYLGSHPAAMLAWEMGTGKTRAVIARIRKDRPRLALVIAPKKVCRVWPPEFAEFGEAEAEADPDPPRVVVLDGATSAKKLIQARAAHASTDARPLVFVANYESIWRGDLGSWALSQPWSLIVLDESQRAKDPFGRCGRFIMRLGKCAPRKICLTGTPMPHSPLDLFNQFRFLDATIFGWEFTRFKATYAVTQRRQFGRKKSADVVVGFKNLDDMHKKLSSISNNVKKANVLDLPPVTHQLRSVELGREARRVYSGLETRLKADVGTGEVTAANVMVRSLRLQQVTSGYASVEKNSATTIDSAKADALAEVLEDIATHESVVVFCRFRYDLEVVEKTAKALGRGYCELSGRRDELDLWGSTRGAVLGAQIRSGSLGISLVQAATAIYYSATWSLGEFDQSVARLDRAGQTRSVTCVHLLAHNTIDESIYWALRARRSVVDHVIDGFKTTRKRG